MTNQETTDDLLNLSHELGSPDQAWAILGEGNTSARIDDQTFIVKASGAQLSTLTSDQIVTARFAPLLQALTNDRTAGDNAVRTVLRDSIVTTTYDLERNGESRLPSVETLFHALLLNVAGIGFVGHTHVTSINSLLCSENGWRLMQHGGRLFPDEIVVCGVAPCCVPYTDPGLPLARAIRAQLLGFEERYGETPRTIYLQNHGFIALGRSAKEVLSITRMADKAAQILLGAIAAGTPRFLSDTDVRRIATRPDEHVRQRALGLKD